MTFKFIYLIVSSLLIAYLMSPMIEYFEKKGLPRKQSLFFAYGLSMVILSSLAILLFPILMQNVQEFTYELPKIAALYQQKANAFYQLIATSGLPPDVKEWFLDEMQSGGTSLRIFTSEKLKQAFISSMQNLPDVLSIFLSIFISYYLLRDREEIKGFIFSLFPAKYRKEITLTEKEIHWVLKGFIQGQLLIAVLVALLEMIGLWFVGLRFPIFLGIIGGMFNLIPYIGPAIGAIPALFVAFSQSPRIVVGTLLVFIIVQQLENVWISPRVLEGKIGIHPLTTILVVWVGGELYGIRGMIFAIPIFAISRIIFRRSFERIIERSS